MSRKNGEDPRRRCPQCGEQRLNPHQKRNALSRVDNKTRICSSCSVNEAMRNLRDEPIWPNYPEPIERGAR